MWWGVRPFLERRRDLGVPAAVAMAFACAWATEMIGIHAIFGAFLAGVVMPHDPGDRAWLVQRLEVVVGTLYVSGCVRGKVVTGKKIVVHRGGKLLADITTPALIIEEGGIFEGSCDMKR